jgi:acetyl esterase/lipase
MARLSIKTLFSRWYFRCLCYILILVSLSGVVTIMNLDRLLFPTPPPTPVSGNCQLNAGAAVLDALWLEGQKDHPVILYSHGNYETLQDMRSLCYEFRLQGYSVLAYDYAGYGASTGKASEKQAYLDIEAAYDYLLREKDVSPENIIAVGYSVGTGPSCHLAQSMTSKPWCYARHLLQQYAWRCLFHSLETNSKTSTNYPVKKYRC